MQKKINFIFAALLLKLLLYTKPVYAQNEIPFIKGPGDVSTALQIIFVLTILALAPSILVMLTSFTRTLIVFSFVRNSMGVQQVPPNQVLIGLALFMTIFIMTPVWSDINEQALTPYLNNEIDSKEAFRKAQIPLRDFMFRQTREKDLALFIHHAKLTNDVDTINDVPTYVLIPAFIISELKTAFQMGFIIFLPFLVIDLIVSSTLMSMGMLMLPPVMISLPFKILLFVMVDGWNIVVNSLLTSFR